METKLKKIKTIKLTDHKKFKTKMQKFEQMQYMRYQFEYRSIKFKILRIVHISQKYLKNMKVERAKYIL